jgi:hypothetical protein
MKRAEVKQLIKENLYCAAVEEGRQQLDSGKSYVGEELTIEHLSQISERNERNVWAYLLSLPLREMKKKIAELKENFGDDVFVEFRRLKADNDRRIWELRERQRGVQ